MPGMNRSRTGIERAGTVSRMDCGHSPFLARPAELTAIVQETLAALVVEAAQ